MTTVKERYENARDSKGRVFISLTEDSLFKVTFGMKRNHKFLEALLESYFGFNDGYLSNKLTTNYELTLDKDKYLDKSVRTDLTVYFDNMVVNIEMYKVFDEEARSKSNYYVMKINTNQIQVGNKYESYKQITQINFIKEDKIGIEEKIYSNINIGKSKTLIHNILLDNKEQYLYTKSERFYKFLRIFSAASYEEREEIAKGDEILMELNSWVFDYCHEGEEKYFNDVYWNERIQRNQGRIEGINIGIQERNIEIAKNLINKLPTNEIAEATGLSINEIEALKEEA